MITDQNGVEIKEGDILRYQETEDEDDYGKSIDEVIAINGVLYGKKRIGLPCWVEVHDLEPIELRHYCHIGTTQARDARIIGTVSSNPEMLLPEFGFKTFPKCRR